MPDSMIRSTDELLEEIAEGPDGRLRAWLRERDRLGALPETHAALDDAYARGYAQGVEDAQEEQLDSLRTVLFKILEARFSEIDDTAMDRIGEAQQATLTRWMSAAVSASSVEEALRG